MTLLGSSSIEHICDRSARYLSLPSWHKLLERPEIGVGLGSLDVIVSQNLKRH